jgi:hypothetical protein
MKNKNIILNYGDPSRHSWRSLIILLNRRLTVAAPFQPSGRAIRCRCLQSSAQLSPVTLLHRSRLLHAPSTTIPIAPTHAGSAATHQNQPRHTPPCHPTKRQTIFRWYFMPGVLVECRSGRAIAAPCPYTRRYTPHSYKEATGKATAWPVGYAR